MGSSSSRSKCAGSVRAKYGEDARAWATVSRSLLAQALRALLAALLLESSIEDAAGPHDSHRLRRRYDLTAL